MSGVVTGPPAAPAGGGKLIVLTAPLTEIIDHAGYFIQMSMASLPMWLEGILNRKYPRWRNVEYNPDGTAKYMPAGVRVLEASLLRRFRADDIICCYPDDLAKFVGPNTRIVAVSTHNPLGVPSAVKTCSWCSRRSRRCRNSRFRRTPTPPSSAAAPGAVVNATIKSGTNAVRGSVYEFLRNDHLDANNFFSNALGAPKPKRERNQFGGAAGGPLVKNRTFWFGDYEGNRDLEGVPRVRQVPTAAEKAGLFSSVVVDPFASGRPEFSRNAQGQWVIPRERWDPVGAAIVAMIPDPNVAGSTIYASTPVTDTRTDQFDVRIDHQVSPTMTLFGRYSFVDTLTFRPAPLEGLAEGSFNDAFGANDMRSQGLALGLTWTVSPTLVGDIRFGYSRGDYYTTPPNYGVDGPAAIGLKNVPSDPAIMGGVPKVNMQGFDAVGRHTSTPQFQTPRSWNPRATFSLSRGAHFLKFGGEFLHVQTRINDLNATIGRMNFENRFTNRAVGDLLLGLPSQLALTSYTVMDQGQDMQFYFVQDDYRISPKLTANVGLRYEYATPPLERDNQFANFDPATGTMIFATDGDTFDRALIHPDRNNFAPRIGFAYTPASRWVVRGGYGVFYTHTVRQGREGTARVQPAVPGRQPAADRRHGCGGRGLGGAVPAGRRLSIGPARSDSARPDHQPPRAGRQSAHALHPAIQHRRSVRADARRRARRRLRRQQGHEIERLPQPQPARGHHQRRRLTERRRTGRTRRSATSSGWRTGSTPATTRCSSGWKNASPTG